MQTHLSSSIPFTPSYFILYEYAIRLEMKDALVDCHEFYRFPLPPLCSTSPPYFRTRVFRGFRDFWGLKKKKKKKKVRMDAINKQQTTNKQRRGGISFYFKIFLSFSFVFVFDFDFAFGIISSY